MKKLKFLILTAVFCLIAASYSNAQMHQVNMYLYVTYPSNSNTPIDLAAFLRHPSISITEGTNGLLTIKAQGLITQTQEIQALNITPEKGINKITVYVEVGPAFGYPYAAGVVEATIKKDYKLILNCKIEKLQ